MSEIRNVDLLRLGFESFAREGPGGVEVEVDTAFLFEIREAKVTRFHVYADTEQALSAAASLARES